jgi:8-oxo-dGTP diphosphatase
MKVLYVARGIVRHQRKYLMLKKLTGVLDEDVGMWETPGGRIEKNEDPKKAILREIKEEINLDCKIIKELPLLHVIDKQVDSTAHIFLLNSTTDKITLSHEHSDYKWCTIDEIKTLNTVYTDLLLKNLELAEKIK